MTINQNQSALETQENDTQETLGISGKWFALELSLIGFSKDDLALLSGIDQVCFERNDTLCAHPHSAAQIRAIQLFYKSINYLYDGDTDAAQAWLTRFSDGLGAIPRYLIMEQGKIDEVTRFVRKLARLPD